MASYSQNAAERQVLPAAMDGVAQGPEQTGHNSSSSCLGLASVNPSDDIISDSLNQAEHLHRQSASLKRKLYPVIYTKYHFEVLKLRIVQYTIDSLRKHKERGFVITSEEIDRHWHRQIKREYSESHPLRTTLQKQASITTFMSHHLRDADLSSSQVPNLSDSV